MNNNCDCSKTLPAGWHKPNCPLANPPLGSAESLVKTFPTAPVDGMENLADKKHRGES